MVTVSGVPRCFVARHSPRTLTRAPTRRKRGSPIGNASAEIGERSEFERNPPAFVGPSQKPIESCVVLLRVCTARVTAAGRFVVIAPTTAAEPTVRKSRLRIRNLRDEASNDGRSVVLIRVSSLDSVLPATRNREVARYAVNKDRGIGTPARWRASGTGYAVLSCAAGKLPAAR